MGNNDEVKRMGNYDIEVWSVKDLIDALENNPTRGKKVIVPKFQRSLVWSPKQKREFINTVKRGYPFGAMLLALEKDGEYTLLDGLQRTSSIREHVKNPNKSFDGNNLNETLLSFLLRIIKRNAERENVERLRNVITKWIQNQTGFEEAEGYSSK